MGAVWHDVKHGLRLLGRSPGFAAIAILTLALGIGANTAIYGLVDAVLLHPLPYPGAGRLVEGWLHHSERGFTFPVRRGVAQVWREQATTLSAVAEFDTDPMALTGEGDPEEIQVAPVTPSLFSILGVPPQIGRSLVKEDGASGAEKVLLLSHRLWQRRFGGEPTIVGRNVTLDGAAYRVVGVMPDRFRFPPTTGLPIAAWVSLPDVQSSPPAASEYVTVLAQMRDGASVEQVRAETAAITSALADENPALRGWTSEFRTPQETIPPRVRTAAQVLPFAVGFVLLIACANVAHLLLARSLPRRREFALRAACGASRLRLVRQLFAENCLLAVLGGAAGLLPALWLMDVAKNYGGSTIPQLESARLNVGALAFTLGLSFCATFLFGSWPVLQFSKPNLVDSLRVAQPGIGGAPRAKFWLRAFVIAELAVATVLLSGAGLLLASFQRLQAVDAGFDGTGVTALEARLSAERYPNSPSRSLLAEKWLQLARTAPGVETAAIANVVPLDAFISPVTLEIEGRELASEERRVSLSGNTVTVDYFRILRIPLREGRLFSVQDTAASEPVAIISERLAKRFWSQQNPVGRRIRVGRSGDWTTIVGVVGEVRQIALDGTVDAPQIYYSFRQHPLSLFSLLVRTRESEEAPVSILKSMLWSLETDQPVRRFRTMDQVRSEQTARPRFTALLVALFAGTAMALAVVGAYGVMAFLVTQRTLEIGMRIALGAQPREIFRATLAQGVALALLGLGAGLVGTIGLTRFLRSLLFEIQPLDPLVIGTTSSLLFGVVLLASWLPARRAMQVDPVVALRSE